ncbi:MAG: amidohydrolase/deacetylase family metallohydrolase [Gammaproteobacteria bacterium]
MSGRTGKATMHDLLLKGGRVIDPALGHDELADVAFADGRVAEIRPNLPASAARDVRDVRDRLVVPGLIDLHTHVYWGGTSIGVDPEAIAFQGATATLVDAGTAGPANLAGFRRHVIDPAAPRILPYINVAFPGIFAFSETVMVGECEDIRLVDARECLRAARAHADLVVGVKVRVGRHASGANGVAPLDIAIEVAEELGLPVMAHLDLPPPGRREVMQRLRPGDVLTHCFRPFPNAPAKPDGGVREEVLAARERGVIFDIGHGKGSFGFGTARAMLENGFAPDCISSDVHSLSIAGPAYDLLVTLSKFLCLGMPLVEVIRAATGGPAAALRRGDLGTLAPGLAADASVLELREGAFEYEDVDGVRLAGKQRLLPAGLVLGGRWWAGPAA